MGASRLFGWPDPAGCSPTPGDGTVEACVAEAEDPTVGGHQPIPAPGDGGCDADDGTLQRDPAHGTVEGGGAEREDAAVGPHQPVAPRRRTERERLRTPGRGEVVRALLDGGNDGAGALAHEEDGQPVGTDRAGAGRRGGDVGRAVTSRAHGGREAGELDCVGGDVGDGRGRRCRTTDDERLGGARPGPVVSGRRDLRRQRAGAHAHVGDRESVGANRADAGRVGGDRQRAGAVGAAHRGLEAAAVGAAACGIGDGRWGGWRPCPRWRWCPRRRRTACRPYLRGQRQVPPPR